jgi:hypothetical protein
MTIFAPSATNISAVRRPMPLVAPVMTATLPLNRPMPFSPCLSDVDSKYISGLTEQRKQCLRRSRILPGHSLDLHIR